MGFTGNYSLTPSIRVKTSQNRHEIPTLIALLHMPLCWFCHAVAQTFDYFHHFLSKDEKRDSVFRSKVLNNDFNYRLLYPKF